MSTQSLVFRGIDGTECEEFIANLLQRVFDEGKTRDFEYIADLAGTCFRGEALRWYMDLDDDVPADWRRLRRAMLTKYPPNSQQANDTKASASIPTPAAAPRPRPPSPRPARRPSAPREDESPHRVTVSSPNALSDRQSIEMSPRRSYPIRITTGPLNEAQQPTYRNGSYYYESPDNLSTRSISSRRSSRPLPGSTDRAEEARTPAEDLPRPRLTSSASEDLDIHTGTSFRTEISLEPSAAWSVIPREEPLLPSPTSAEPDPPPIARRRIRANTLASRDAALPPRSRPLSMPITTLEETAADRSIRPKIKNQGSATKRLISSISELRQIFTLPPRRGSVASGSSLHSATPMIPASGLGNPIVHNTQTPDSNSVHTISARIRVVTRDGQEDLGYVAGESVSNHLTGRIHFFVTVGLTDSLFVLATSDSRQAIKLKDFEGGFEHLGAEPLDWHKFSADGIAQVVPISAYGQSGASGDAIGRDSIKMWRLHLQQGRIVPEMRQTRGGHGWCEASVFFGHFEQREVGLNVVPSVLLLVPLGSEDLLRDGLEGSVPWEQVDLLLDEV